MNVFALPLAFIAVVLGFQLSGPNKQSFSFEKNLTVNVSKERLWKALVQWYGGSPSLPRQVIRNKQGEIELELHPLSLKLLKHQMVPRSNNQVPAMVSGYSAAVASQVVPTSQSSSPYGNSLPSTRRYHAYQATFSRRTKVKQIVEFLTQRLHIKLEDLRLWYFRSENQMDLLEDENKVRQSNFGLDIFRLTKVLFVLAFGRNWL